jgi:methyl-accepting chemotaxis protein
MNRFFHLQESPDPKIRNAFRYASIILVADIVAFLVDIFLAARTGAWQLWAGTASILGMLVASIISRQMILRGKTDRGIQVLIYSILAGFLVNPFFIADIGLALSLMSVMVIMEIASRTVERPEHYIITGFMVAGATILLDMSLPPYRLVVPELQIFIPVIAGIMIILLGIMTWRGFSDYNLRTKVIVVIITIVTISIGTISVLTNRTLSSNLTESIGNNLYANANSVATGVAEVIDRDTSLLKTLSFDQRIRISVEVANLEKTLSQSEIEQLDSQWRNADNDDLLIAGVLQNTAAPQLRQFQKEFPQNVEIVLTNQQGVLLAATNRTSDYYQADEEWWQTAFKDGIYIGPPEYDESSKTTAMIIAISVQEQGTKEIGGVLRTTVSLDSFTQALGAGLFGKTGQAVVYLPDGRELALEPGAGGIQTITVRKSGFDAAVLSQSKNTYFQTNYNQTPVFASQFGVAQLPEGASETGTVPDEATSVKARAMANLNMRVVVFQEQKEARQLVERQTTNLVVTAFIIFIVATIGALGLAQVISGPIIRLNAVAEKVAAGDLSAQAKIETGDETGTLAQTFNSMTGQLRDLIGTLEQRVADRTKALAASAEVSRNLSTILNEQQLIAEVVEQLKATFDYYDVHIYLVDEASGDLIMAGGTGDAGTSMLESGHKVSKGRGPVGRAAQNNVPVLVSDTSKDPGWSPHPLLPETQSEAAVPIATADRVLGVLDVQHNIVGGLKQEDVDLLQSLANQVAIALLNARSYVEVQQRAEREAHITSIGLKIKSSTSIEAALQATAHELGRTLGVNDIRVILEAPGLPQDDRKPD